MQKQEALPFTHSKTFYITVLSKAGVIVP